jgi:hypothetical protein
MLSRLLLAAVAAAAAQAAAAAHCPPPLRSAVNATVDPAKVPWFWMVLDRRGGLSYTYVPKAMSTSLRTIMNAREAGKGGCRNRLRDRCAEVKKTPALRAENITRMTRFFVLRDPFERLLSAYHNSATNEFIHVGRCITPKDCTFEEFVNELARHKLEAGNLDFNEHFKPQVEIARFASMHYHYVFRMSCRAHVDCIYRGLLGTSLVQLNAREKCTPTAHRACSAPKPTRKADVIRAEDQFPPHVVRAFMTMYKEDVDVWKATECTGPHCDCTPTTADKLAL